MEEGNKNEARMQVVPVVGVVVGRDLRPPHRVECRPAGRAPLQGVEACKTRLRQLACAQSRPRLSPPWTALGLSEFCRPSPCRSHSKLWLEFYACFDELRPSNRSALRQSAAPVHLPACRYLHLPFFVSIGYLLPLSAVPQRLVRHVGELRDALATSLDNPSSLSRSPRRSSPDRLQ